jgi:hypothetical protein
MYIYRYIFTYTNIYIYICVGNLKEDSIKAEMLKVATVKASLTATMDAILDGEVFIYIYIFLMEI